MKKIILIFLSLFLASCAQRTLAIVIPNNPNPEQQSQEIINSFISAMQGLKNNPDNIKIVFQNPKGNEAPN